MRILYVEDDPTARSFIEQGLARRGFAVDVASDGTEGLDRAIVGDYDAIVLDIMLPDLDGFALLAELRDRGIQTPTLFLSARGEVHDRIQGFAVGADDYLPKPFAFAELLARIQAISRRRRSVPSDGLLVVADLVMDLPRHRVTRAGRDLELSPRQFALLEYLARNRGCVLSRSMIIENVWGFGFQSRSNAIDVQITYLRKRIDRDFEPKLIHTVKGVGYLLEDRSRPPDA